MLLLLAVFAAKKSAVLNIIRARLAGTNDYKLLAPGSLLPRQFHHHFPFIVCYRLAG